MRFLHIIIKFVQNYQLNLNVTNEHSIYYSRRGRVSDKKRR